MSRKILGAAFDMDGLMVDTECVIFKIWSKILKENGFELTLEMFKKTVGLRSSDTRLLYTEHFGSAFDYDIVYKRSHEMFWEIFYGEGIPLKPGLFELLNYLKENGIKTAVATSTSRKTAEVMLKGLGLLPYFDALVYGDMIENGKPAPDIYIKAASLMGLESKDCIGLEDSLNGIRTVYSSGMRAIMVPDMLEPTEDILPMLYAKCDTLCDVIEVIKPEAGDVI